MTILNLIHYLFLLLSPILLIASGCVGDVECLPDQRSLLLELKRGFISTEILATWLPNTNCCNWEGITCNSETGQVVGLDLSFHSFPGGNISSSLFNLTSLHTLNFAYSSFSYDLPIPQSGFEKLVDLTQLNLSNAGHGGQIPIGISRLTRLTTLDLSNCYSEGNAYLSNPNLTTLIRNLSNLRELYLDCVDLSYDNNWSSAVSMSLPRLQVLRLSSCNLPGLLNKDIFQLRNLMVLDLSGNWMLSGVMPKHFSKANTLKSLVISYTSIYGNLPDSIGNLTELVLLDLSHNQLSGVIPTSIEKLTRLKHLDLAWNNFRGMIPHTIGKVVQLEHLDLSDNNLEGMIPSSVGNLTNLVLLKLISTGISGEIPSSIGKLPKLVHLDLSNNNLSGSFPSFVPWARIQDLVLSGNNIGGSFPSSNYSVRYRHLRLLDLSFNSISGSIPANIFSLPALQRLILTNNQLSELGGVFSCPLTQLWYIDLSHNQLQGAIPMSLFKLSALQTLYIASNNFSGTVEMDMFESRKNLTNLDISNNKLTIEDTNGYYNPSFPKFYELNFASCNLTKIPAFLRYQDKISSLDLSNNRISGDIPKWLWSVGNESLTSLNLSCNLFTHLEGPTELSTTPLFSLDLHSNKLQGPIPLPPKYIRYLDYSDNNFSSIIPSNIFSSGFISYISLANNRLTGDIPKFICGFLSVLDLSNNSLSGSIPSCFFELDVLNLRGNQLQGIIPQTSGECNLGTLILSDNNLEGQLPRSLINCSDLEVLDVGNNQIKDSFPFWLGNFVKLRVLILKENEFYGPVELPENHEANYTFPKLQLFDLSANHFSGNLSSKCFSGLTLMIRNSKLNYSAAGLGNLSSKCFSGSTMYRDSITITVKGIKYALSAELSIFMSIDFSNNGFEGTIPDAIGELQGLHRLNLSNNALKGGIPLTIRNLKQLESLDLSENNLSGLIPLELTSVTFLSFLNLSNNNLIGKIPQANQLSTFSNSSFLGNPGLCGNPLSKQCDSVNNRNDTRNIILKPDHSSRNYVIGLALFTGLGFGVGFAMVIVLQNVPLKLWRRKATAARN